MAPWVYMGPAAPKWVLGRSDRIYLSTIPGMRRGIAYAMNPDAGDDVEMITPTVKEMNPLPGNRAWLVTYTSFDYTIEYKLRPKARWHGEPQSGLNALSPGQRQRDFTGNVLVSNCFLVLPSDGKHKKSVSVEDAGLKDFGIGFRYADMSQGTKLRTWLNGVLKLQP